jgi:Tfp pilus assembly protein PilV
MLIRNTKHDRGFSMIEAIVASAILATGLLAIAGLLANLASTTNYSRYTGTQTLLASEKLEDLNLLSACDPDIAVPAGSTSGSLTSDQSQTVNAQAGPPQICGSEVVNYFDDVQISSEAGAITETTNGVSLAQTPNGEVKTTAPPTSSDMLLFHRRWIIEKDQPIPGARRITVVVIAQTGNALDKAATFQTTLVRQ